MKRDRGVPASLEDLVRPALEASALPMGERHDVERYLRAHFEDGLAAGVAESTLRERFGDPEAAGRLIARSRSGHTAAPRVRMANWKPASHVGGASTVSLMFREYTLNAAPRREGSHGMARQNATPKQTSGGGYPVETEAVAWTLAHMLNRSCCPFDPPGGIIERVDTQLPASQWHLDDLLVTVSTLGFRAAVSPAG